MATTSNGLSASVGVLVTAPPRIGAYTVTDLSPVPATADLLLNDSGDVLLQNAAVLYRDGVGAAIQGCVFGAALNNVSQVLCHPSGRETSASEYSLWRGGVFTPVAADTFTAARMSLGGLNDSGVVAGQVVGPVFHNTACAAQSGCLIYFLDGAPAFKSDPSSATSMFTRQLNNRRDLIFDMGTFSPNDGRIGAFQVPWSTGPVRGSSVFIRAENDQGALAIEDNELDRAHSRFYTIARIVQPGGTVTDLGDGAATGINNAGSVTGTLTALGPFLFSSGAVSLLTKAPVDQGWTVSNALKINNRGQILARASHADGRASHWILMTPVTP